MHRAEQLVGNSTCTVREKAFASYFRPHHRWPGHEPLEALLVSRSWVHLNDGSTDAVVTFQKPVTWLFFSAGWVVYWKVQFWAFWSATKQKRWPRCPLSGFGSYAKHHKTPLWNNLAFCPGFPSKATWRIYNISGEQNKGFSLLPHTPRQPGFGTLIMVPCIS